jgi:uncharacterized membrane protein
MLMLKKVLKRLKNKKVILAVVSGLMIILVNLGIVDITVSDKVTDMVTTLLTVGVAIGIFSNPDIDEHTETE